MNGKKVNVQVVEQITDTELKNLTAGLRSIEGFDFLVDAQATVRSRS